jgi:outer membrane lipoprotein-sorting protein
MRGVSRRRIVGLTTLCLAPLAVAAAPAPTTSLSAEDNALVARAVAYLDGLTCDEGRFEQIDGRGALTTGTFFLQRPGRARFDYDPPSGLVIASNGFKVTIVDHRLKTIQGYPLAFTPLGLFLAKNIRLDRGVMVTGVDRTAAGFSITARDRAHPNQGSIDMTFTNEPIRLAGWTVTDSRGQSVQVRLAALTPATPRSWRFFELADPAREGPRSPAP